MPTPRQELCKRGHRIADNPYISPRTGHRTCRQCRQIWKREQGNKHRTYLSQPGLVPTGGLPWRTAWAKYLMVLRQIRYGTTPTEKQVESGKRLGAQYGTPQRFTTHCQRGHEYAKGDNLRWTSAGGRQCRSCDRIRGNTRPLWVKDQGVRISVRAHDTFYRRAWQKLRRAVLAAHPDVGGTAAKFIKARKAEQTFLTREAVWYEQYSITPPALTLRDRKWSTEALARANTPEAKAKRGDASRKGHQRKAQQRRIA